MVSSYDPGGKFITPLKEAGLHFHGASEDGLRMEVFSVATRRYHVGCQFHPELKSRPEAPSPLHRGLVEAAAAYAAAKSA